MPNNTNGMIYQSNRFNLCQKSNKHENNNLIKTKNNNFEYFTINKIFKYFL